ncbi:MAG: hypothetical protein D6722_29385 [Bacteroidetes bacterium]|nr:MAG: hypothetical protein D6722_29385 [Bacteroidota bacterium]
MNLRHLFLLWTAWSLWTGFPGPLQAQCVFFSAYIEGSGNNKCLEIYNGTGAPLDLGGGGYEIAVYSNGAAVATSVTALTGVVAVGDVFVICNPAALAGMLAEADATSGNMNFNGDDAVELRGPGGITLDVIGQIGFDPGTGWTGTNCGTLNQSLERDPALGCPGFDGASAFEAVLDTEWSCLPQDDFSGLGSFTPLACGLSNLSVSQSSCANGAATVSLDFNTTGTVGPQFALTVTPDPGGLSGTYAYAALPLSLPGFIGDNATAYAFTVSDLSGTCTDASLSGQTFLCPVADALAFTLAPGGCVETGVPFSVTVCAIETSSGLVQPDYTGTISLSPGPGATGIITAGGSAPAVNGCATISLVYDTEEAVSFQASDGTLSDALSPPLDLRTDCPGLSMTAAMVNPCGNDSPNEYVAAVTEALPINVGEIVVASIDHLNGPQPNSNFTWAALDTAEAGNPAEVCGAIGLQCHRWLDRNEPADAVTLTTLVNALNAQAGCALFSAPLPGGDRGIIPAHSQVIFFLGAGGNAAGTILPGFDGLGTNLDFSGYCGQGPIYAVIGEHKNPGATFGFFSNGAARTIQILVAGTEYASFPYTPPPTPGPAPQYVNSTGSLATDPDCTPPDLFGPVILPAVGAQISARYLPGTGVALRWAGLPGTELMIERAQGAEAFVPQAWVPAQRETWLDRDVMGGHYTYRLRSRDVAGSWQAGLMVEVVVPPSLEVQLRSQGGRLQLWLQAGVAGEGTLGLYDMQGRRCVARSLHWGGGTRTWDLPALAPGLYRWHLTHAGMARQGWLRVE